MNLPIANVIRKLRREREVTQEELAASLGVTYQSVSRWENGQAYPDMELIPKIAHFFGISTDVLFGTDASAKEALRQEHFRKVEQAFVPFDAQAYYAASKAAYADCPHEYWFGVFLLRSYIEFRVRPYKEHMEEIREICRNIIDNCRDDDVRNEAYHYIVQVEDDDKLDVWLDKVPNVSFSRDALLELRYDFRNEVDKCNHIRQENFRSYILEAFYNGIGKRDEKRYKNPEASMVGHKLALDMLDMMRNPEIDVDAWMGDRAFLYLRMSAGCFGAGCKEEGYAALQKAVDLYVQYAELPIGTKLFFHCPVLDLLTKEKLYDENWEIPDEGEYGCYMAYSILKNPVHWEWFHAVWEEERYKAQIARLEKYVPVNLRDSK